jgi:ribosome-associated protein
MTFWQKDEVFTHEKGFGRDFIQGNLVSFAGCVQFNPEDKLMAKRKKASLNDPEKLSDLVVKGMQEKKASDIVLMDLRKVKNAVADFFVICSGNSDKQLDAIADSVDEMVFKGLKENPWHVEGKSNKEWMILDYTNVVVHIFRKDRRSFYGLEKLWGDADITEIEE